VNKKILYVLSATFLTLFAYQNCSLVQGSHRDFNRLGKSCLAVVQKAFNETYYPHLRRQCATCHDNNGTGIGWFASRDPDMAFNAFLTTTREKIDAMMVYDGHPGPYNGPAQQSFLDSNKARWDEAESVVELCNAGNTIETQSTNTSVGQVNIPNGNGDPNRRPWRILEWDLFAGMKDPELTGKIHLVVRMQYREAQANGVDIGYEFTRPMARIRTGAPAGTQYAIDKISVVRNGKLMASVTGFLAVDNFVVSATTDTLLIDSGASLGLVPTDAEGNAIKDIASDMFSLRFAEVRDANGEPISSAPVIPVSGGTGPAVPARVTYAQLMDAGNTLGYMARNCVSCHSAGNAQGGLNLQSYAQAAAAAASIKSRVNSSTRPMPTAGLLPQYDRAVITQWVDIGAPQN